jgi:uncharacterized protein involved in exopolysaccharide biosynthesis
MEIAEVRLSFYLDVLRRHWLAIGLSVAAACCLALAYCFIATKTYIAQAILLPEEGEPGLASPLSMLAGNFGFAAPKSGKNSELYKDVVKSRQFIETLLQEKYLTERKDSLAIDSFYNYRKYPMPVRLDALSKKFSHTLSVIRNENGIILLKLETHDPVYSAELLSAILRHLETFFKEQEARKTEKSLEFIREKLGEKEKQFRASGQNTAAFLAQNQYIDPLKTPHLHNRLESLKREERIQEEIYLLLYKEYEKARIDKQKEKSAMQVLEYPVPALEKDKPKRRKILVTTLAISFLLAYVLFALSDRFRMKA